MDSIETCLARVGAKFRQEPNHRRTKTRIVEALKKEIPELQAVEIKTPDKAIVLKLVLPHGTKHYRIDFD